MDAVSWSKVLGLLAPLNSAPGSYESSAPDCRRDHQAAEISSMRARTYWGSVLCIAMGWGVLGAIQAAEPPAKAPSASRQAYDACFKQAEQKKLDGQARLDFMAQCMQVKLPSGTIYN